MLKYVFLIIQFPESSNLEKSYFRPALVFILIISAMNTTTFTSKTLDSRPLPLTVSSNGQHVHSGAIMGMTDVVSSIDHENQFWNMHMMFRRQALMLWESTTTEPFKLMLSFTDAQE